MLNNIIEFSIDENIKSVFYKLFYILKDDFHIEKSFAIVAVDKYLIVKNHDDIFENSKNEIWQNIACNRFLNVSWNQENLYAQFCALLHYTDHVTSSPLSFSLASYFFVIFMVFA